MASPLLIIVTGAPGTGKTTVSLHIADAFHLPVISKDRIKVALFRSLGWKDRAWSKRLSVASMELLFLFAEVQLQTGRSLVVESNFYPGVSTTRFLELREKCPFEPFQILCRADPDILVQRYRQRVYSLERHPGHLDHGLVSEFDPHVLLLRHSALAVDGPVFCMDTTDIADLDYGTLFQAISVAMGDIR